MNRRHFFGTLAGGAAGCLLLQGTPASGGITDCEAGSPFYEYSPWPRSVCPDHAPKPVRAVRYLAGCNKEEVCKEVGSVGSFFGNGAALKFPWMPYKYGRQNFEVLEPGDWVVRFGSHRLDHFFINNRSFRAIFHQNR